MTNIKITALTDIGNNIAPTTLVPVVDMAGPSTTKKANLQNVGNLILNGAGGSNFVPAARAILSQSVTNAAQPNITSTGTLTSLTVSGNVNLGSVNNLTITGGNPGQLLATDGSGALSWVNDPSGVYNNSNVANYLPTFTGTVGANRISSNALSGSNVEIDANGAVFMFGQGGALQWPAPNGNLWAIEPNSDNEFEIKSTSNVVISTDISDANSHFTFDGEGIFTAPSNVNLLGTRLNIGSDSIAAELVNPTIVISTSGSEYIQAAIINSSSNGSSDWAAYGEGADDFQAFADLGFAGHTFNDANFSITNPGDAYVFGQGYANGIGGALVLATGENGNVPDIVFATGGFTSGTEFARIDHANNVFHLTRANSGIQFADGSIQTTAGGGGANTANVTFDDVTVQGDDTALNLSAGPDFTANLAYLQVRAGDVASHIHFDTGNSEAYDLIIGNDQKFVQVSSTGNIIMSSYDSANVLTYTMTLDNTGNLNLSDGNSIIRSLANSSLDPLNPNVSTMVLTPDSTLVGQSLVLDPTAPGHIHLRAPGPAIDQPFANIFLGGEESSFEVGYYNGAAPNVFVHSGNNTWTFDTAGNLELPINGNINVNGGGITQVINEDLNIVVQDEEDDGWSLLNTITDSIGNNLAQTSLDSSSFTIDLDILGADHRWQFDGNTLQVTKDSTVRGFDANVTIQSMVSGNGGTTSLQSVSNINDPNIFTTIDATTTGANIKVYDGGSVSGTEYVWQFDESGNLTFPDNTVQSTAWTGILPNPTYIGSDEIGEATPAPLNLNNSAEATLLTQLNLINTGGGPGSGSAIDFWTYTSINDVPEVRLQAVDDGDYSANFSIALKGTGNSGTNGLATEWKFNSDGVLTLPGEGVIRSNDDTVILQSYDTGNAVGKGIRIGTNGSVYFEDGSDTWLSIDNVSNNAVLTSAANSYVRIASNNGSQNWYFESDGNLTLSGNTVAINFANGTAAFGNVVSVNLDGNISNVLLGNGAFAAIPSSSIIANGNSNVSIASSNGNVVINAVGNTTMTVTGTGANVTGTLGVSGNVTAANLPTKFAGTWTVPTGNSTQSFTVDSNNTYQMWLEGNIPNGIISWNALVSITNINVPVLGQQFAWNYEGGGNLLMFNSIPDQIIGTAGAISNVEPVVSNANTFTFSINNASGNAVTVNYGWVKLS